MVIWGLYIWVPKYQSVVPAMWNIVSIGYNLCLSDPLGWDPQTSIRYLVF